MKVPVFYFLFSLVWLTSLAHLNAQNLAEIVSAAVARSPVLKSAHARIDGASSRFGETRAMRYPRLSIRSSYMRSDNPVYAFGSLLEQAAFGPQNFAIDSLNNPSYLTNIKNALDLGLPLFTGFNLSTNEEIVRYAMSQADAEFEMTAQNVRFQTIQNYLDVLLKTEALAVIEQRINAASNEIDGARRLNAKGLVLGSDFYAAEAILSGLRAQHVRTRQQLETARRRLAVTTDLKAESIVVSGKMEAEPYDLGDETRLVETALAMRQDAAGASLGVQMAQAGVKKASRSYLPTVEAFASIETNTQDFESNPTNRMVGVRSHFPLGDPAYSSRKLGAKASAKAAAGQKEKIEEAIRLDVTDAHGQLAGAVSSLPLIQEAVRQADKSLNLFRPLYREGRQSILDVLRAEEGLLHAQQALLETYYHIHLGYARLLLVTGQLEPQAIAEIERRLEARP